MRTVNNTPFVFQPFRSRVKPPEQSLTLILKGTFDLKPGGVCTPAKKQLPISGDKPYLDDIGRSLAWSTDLAPFKPHTDCYVIGSFYQPNGVAAPEGHAAITLGPLHKELVIRGPRKATQRPDKAWSVTSPEAILTVPLRWEYSFGGLADRRNPLGMGIDPVESENGDHVILLPLIEDPHHPIKALKDRPPPANFAPVPPSFQERRQKLGTRDRRWGVFRAPLPPKDYDPSFHNAAPHDLQAGNYPRGDETLVLRNLHATIAELTTQLPGIRTQVGLLRNTPGGVVAEEVPMHLDTVVVMPDSDQLVLLWRGTTELHMSFMPDEMVQFQCEMAPLGQPPATPGLIERMLAEYRSKQAAAAGAVEAETAHALSEMRKLLAKANLPPEVMKALETETDPQVIHDVLDRQLMSIIESLKQQFPQIAAKLPPM